MMYGYGLGHGFGFFGEIFSLIFWVLIIWLIVGLFKSGGYHGKGCCGIGHGEVKKNDSAMDILRERFAKGEISKEEFEEKTKVLEGEKRIDWKKIASKNQSQTDSDFFVSQPFTHPHFSDTIFN